MALESSRLNLIGQSGRFLAAVKMIERLAACDAMVLIQGEIGTGKEVAARAIHYLGARREGPFTPINCGALPDSLFENELFGHVRGAFTDARDTVVGLIANSEGGTLFLDEVEALSPKGQVALLRFLQDGTYRPLGGKRLVDANVRIIAASNASLRELVARGEFRADLMYRLAVMPLDLPPLRARGGDVQLLARHFVTRFNAQYRTAKQLSPASMTWLETQPWPGNVRELENLLHREVLLCDGETIELDARPPVSDAAFTHTAVVSATSTSVIASGASSTGTTTAIAPASTASSSHSRVSLEFECGFRAAKASWIAEFERSFVCWALEQSGGNMSAAARRAGKERRTFARLVKKYSLGRARPSPHIAAPAQ